MQSIMNCLRHESADAMNCIEDALRCASHRLNSGQPLHHPADGPPPFAQGRLISLPLERQVSAKLTDKV